MSHDDLSNLLSNLSIDKKEPSNSSDSTLETKVLTNSKSNSNQNQTINFNADLLAENLKKLQTSGNLQLHTNINTDLSEMALQFKPEYINCVPQFDGNPSELNRFLATCKTLIEQFYDVTNRNCFQNTYLLHCLIGKLTGSARLVVNVQNVSTWDELKCTLYRHFADTRDESCLNRDLVMLRQGSNESPQNFYDRVLEILNLLVSFVDAHDTVESATIKRSLYQNLALTTFLSGLKEPLGNTIRCMKPIDLAQAIQFVIQENNVRYFQNNTHNPFKQHPHKTQTTKPVINYFPTHQPRFPSFSNPSMTNFNGNFNTNTSHNQFRQPFPSQPIPIRPNNNFRPQKFPTNSQVFGRPNTNVFKPNSSKILPTPTPMSVCTQQTFRTNRSNQFPGQRPSQGNFQQFQPRRNMPTIEEVYNTELDTTPNDYFYNYPENDHYLQYNSDFPNEEQIDFSTNNQYLDQSTIEDPQTSNETENFHQASKDNLIT